MNVERKSLRAALLDREPLLATFLLLPRVEIVEMVAAAGFSAVIIDLEHGPIGVADLPPLLAAANGAGIYAVARLPETSTAAIGQALDTGVDGVMVPHIASVEDAEAVVRAGRYQPAGDRSINPYTRGNRYALGVRETPVDVNDRVALIAMLEGPDALSNLEAICRVRELDAAFIGPVDLAASLGLAGQAEHPSVITAVAESLRRVAAAGHASGVYAPTPEAGARWVTAGASLVALCADIALALRAFTDARIAIEAAAAATASVSISPDGDRPTVSSPEAASTR